MEPDGLGPTEASAPANPFDAIQKHGKPKTLKWCLWEVLKDKPEGLKLMEVVEELDRRDLYKIKAVKNPSAQVSADLNGKGGQFVKQDGVWMARMYAREPSPAPAGPGEAVAAAQQAQRAPAGSGEPQSEAKPEIGMKVKAWWPGERKYFEGRLHKVVDPEQGVWHIKYNDNSEEWVLPQRFSITGRGRQQTIVVEEYDLMVWDVEQEQWVPDPNEGVDISALMPPPHQTRGEGGSGSGAPGTTARHKAQAPLAGQERTVGGAGASPAPSAAAGARARASPADAAPAAAKRPRGATAGHDRSGARETPLPAATAGHGAGGRGSAGAQEKSGGRGSGKRKLQQPHQRTTEGQPSDSSDEAPLVELTKRGALARTASGTPSALRRVSSGIATPAAAGAAAAPAQPASAERPGPAPAASARQPSSSDDEQLGQLVKKTQLASARSSGIPDSRPDGPPPATAPTGSKRRASPAPPAEATPSQPLAPLLATAGAAGGATGGIEGASDDELAPLWQPLRRSGSTASAAAAPGGSGSAAAPSAPGGAKLREPASVGQVHPSEAREEWEGGRRLQRGGRSTPDGDRATRRPKREQPGKEEGGKTTGSEQHQPPVKRRREGPAEAGTGGAALPKQALQAPRRTSGGGSSGGGDGRGAPCIMPVPESAVAPRVLEIQHHQLSRPPSPSVAPKFVFEVQRPPSPVKKPREGHGGPSQQPSQPGSRPSSRPPSPVKKPQSRLGPGGARPPSVEGGRAQTQQEGREQERRDRHAEQAERGQRPGRGLDQERAVGQERQVELGSGAEAERKGGRGPERGGGEEDWRQGRGAEWGEGDGGRHRIPGSKAGQQVGVEEEEQKRGQQEAEWEERPDRATPEQQASAAAPAPAPLAHSDECRLAKHVQDVQREQLQQQQQEEEEQEEEAAPPRAKEPQQGDAGYSQECDGNAQKVFPSSGGRRLRAAVQEAPQPVESAAAVSSAPGEAGAEPKEPHTAPDAEPDQGLNAGTDEVAVAGRRAPKEVGQARPASPPRPGHGVAPEQLKGQVESLQPKQPPPPAAQQQQQRGARPLESGPLIWESEGAHAVKAKQAPSSKEASEPAYKRPHACEQQQQHAPAKAQPLERAAPRGERGEGAPPSSAAATNRAAQQQQHASLPPQQLRRGASREPSAPGAAPSLARHAAAVPASERRRQQEQDPAPKVLLKRPELEPGPEVPAGVAGGGGAVFRIPKRGDAGAHPEPAPQQQQQPQQLRAPAAAPAPAAKGTGGDSSHRAGGGVPPRPPSASGQHSRPGSQQQQQHGGGQQPRPGSQQQQQHGGGQQPRSGSQQPQRGGTGVGEVPHISHAASHTFVQRLLDRNRGALVRYGSQVKWAASVPAIPSPAAAAAEGGGHGKGQEIEERQRALKERYAAWPTKSLLPLRGREEGGDTMGRQPLPDNISCGRILVTSNTTLPQCLERKIFISNHPLDIHNLNKSTMLLIHNFDERLVYGCFRCVESGENLDDSFGKAYKYHVRVQQLAGFAPIPDTLLEVYVARKVHPETGERMKFFEKNFDQRVAKEVWEAFQFYNGKRLPEMNSRWPEGEGRRRGGGKGGGRGEGEAASRNK